MGALGALLIDVVVLVFLYRKVWIPGRRFVWRFLMRHYAVEYRVFGETVPLGVTVYEKGWMGVMYTINYSRPTIGYGTALPRTGKYLVCARGFTEEGEVVILKWIARMIVMERKGEFEKGTLLFAGCVVGARIVPESERVIG